MAGIGASDGDVVIDFPHRGDIRCARLLVVEGGSVVGDVDADLVKVLGRLDGSVMAQLVMVGPTGRLNGSVTAEDAVIAPGGKVRGSLALGIPMSKLDRTMHTAAPVVAAPEPDPLPNGFGGRGEIIEAAAPRLAPEHVPAALAAAAVPEVWVALPSLV